MSKEEMEERQHFRRVVQAFKNYKRDSKERIQRTQNHLKRIPLEHQKLLAKHGFQEGLLNIDACVELNYAVIEDLIADVANIFDNTRHEDDDDQIMDEEKKRNNLITTQMDMEKVQSTLKQFVRDWSEEGKEERGQSYGPILEELDRLYGDLDEDDKSRLKVLVPGAGMGRLSYEIATKGFECQGNEFSLYMLFASNYVLNKCKYRDCYTVYPWIHQFTNNVSSDDPTRPACFPDVDPSELPEKSNFSMVAGDFLEVYNNDDEYKCSQDCVVTCFFIDCAHNVIDFIQLIHKVLKPGGKWINFGPLLYHFADVPRESSIEPSYDIVKSVIESSGFEFVNEETDRKASYCQNPRSMLQYQYKCVFFTCVKK